MLPRSGGWEAQRLSDLAMFQAMNLVYVTYVYKGRKDFEWSKFTATQNALIAWLG